MPPRGRRSAARPDPEDLAELSQPTENGRLLKAPEADPVLGLGSGTGNRASAPPQQAAAAERLTDAGPSGRARRVEQPAASAEKTKVGFYAAPAVVDRARAAYAWTTMQTGLRSFSDFVAAAVAEKTQRLENEYHDGEPWPAIAPGGIAKGRPL